MKTDSSFSYTASVVSMTSTQRTAIMLVLADLLGAIVSLQGFHFFHFGSFLRLSSLALLGTIAVILVIFYLADAYRPDLRSAGLWAPARTLIACCLAGFILAALSYLLNAKILTPLLWRSVLIPSLGAFTLWAVLLRIFATTWTKANAKQSACLFLGAGEMQVQFEQDFLNWNPLARLVILSNDLPPTPEVMGQLRHLGGRLSDLASWSAYPWSGVVVASHLELTESTIQQLMQIRLQGTPVYKLPDFYEMLWQKLPSALLQDTWFAFGGGFYLVNNRINLKLKRLVDIFTASLLLLLLSPVMLMAAILIRLESPGPIFYSQSRNGLNSQSFRVYKFRSMYRDAEQRGAQWAQQRDPRVTRVGYWLRLVRIDELPQLWNVLRGDMSLIGPRPERPEFDSKLAAEIPYYTLRYLVKPGITGWAQVLYPYGASVEDAYEKLSYDLYYIKNYSIWLDLIIALKTIRVVLLGKGR
jgi:exopolysaccharide biosynthesis polyprenyl glycosylphosphotransferase